MPITLLHFGIMAPIKKLKPNKVSSISFVLANIWIDGPALYYAMYSLFGIAHLADVPSHMDALHTFLGATYMGAIIALLGIWSLKWILGAFIGAWSHILLDMLVHADMKPFSFIDGNPFYMGWMEPLSLVLLPLTIWWVVQIVFKVTRHKINQTT